MGNIRGICGLLVRSPAIASIVAAASCGDTRLSPIVAYDASFAEAPVLDTSGPEIPVMDAPAEMPAMDAPPMDVQAMDMPSITVNCPPPALLGYASETVGTRGGQGGMVYTVSTLEALTMYAQMDVPLVIQVDAMIALTDQIRVHSDKTIVGISKGAGLMGGGLYLVDAHNIIISKLTISKATGTDAIGVDNADHIWIDHCDLSSDRFDPESTQTYDGLVDIKHASDHVTVSWNHFHDHYRPSIVGHSNSNAAEDTNHLTVTFHHNWFEQVASNTPRVRFGKVHVLNNLYEHITTNAIISQMSALVLVEGNAFRDVMIPITTVYQDPMQGSVWLKDNICLATCGGDMIQMMSEWAPEYSYNADPTANVALLVTACAGAKF